MGVVDIIGDHDRGARFSGLGAYGRVEIDKKRSPRLIEAIGYGPLKILIYP